MVVKCTSDPDSKVWQFYQAKQQVSEPVYVMTGGLGPKHTSTGIQVSEISYQSLHGYACVLKWRSVS